jgi:hypothetical protein
MMWMLLGYKLKIRTFWWILIRRPRSQPLPGDKGRGKVARKTE